MHVNIDAGDWTWATAAKQGMPWTCVTSRTFRICLEHLCVNNTKQKHDTLYVNHCWPVLLSNGPFDKKCKDNFCIHSWTRWSQLAQPGTGNSGHVSWHVLDTTPKYSEHSDSADMSALDSPAGDLHREVLGRNHTHHVWPLKTSGSCWVPPHYPLRSLKRLRRSATTCPILRQIKKFNSGVSVIILSRCIVNSLMIKKNGAELTSD